MVGSGPPPELIAAGPGVRTVPSGRCGSLAGSGNGGYRRRIMYWMSIEVLNGAFPATRWQDAHGQYLIEAALTHGATNWSWLVRDWGLIFEVEFADEDAW